METINNINNWNKLIKFVTDNRKENKSRFNLFVTDKRLVVTGKEDGIEYLSLYYQTKEKLTFLNVLNVVKKWLIQTFTW